MLVILVLDVEQQKACLRRDRDLDLIVDLEAAAAFPFLFRDQYAQVVPNALLSAFVQSTIERQALHKRLPVVRERLGEQFLARLLPARTKQPVKQHGSNGSDYSPLTIAQSG